MLKCSSLKPISLTSGLEEWGSTTCSELEIERCRIVTKGCEVETIELETVLPTEGLMQVLKGITDFGNKYFFCFF